jgi:hypothetical protein
VWSDMKATPMISRSRARGLFLFIVSLAFAACTIPSVQPTTPPADTVSGITAVSPTQTPASKWKTYQNTDYGFQVSYPEQGRLMEVSKGAIKRIDLPFTQGTNLEEKFVQIDVQENPEVCNSPFAQGYEPGALQADTVTLNGIDFHITSASEGAAGNYYDWTAYSTTRNEVCVIISFVLHSTNPFNYPTPPPEFDRPSEAGVFTEIISTFKWTE